MPPTNLLRSALRFCSVAAVAAGCAVAVVLLDSRESASSVDREIAIVARQYSYEPHRIVVNAGDRLHLRLVSTDVVHGFFVDGHDLEAEVRPGKHGFRVRHPSREKDFRDVEEIVITAGRPGKYRYRCSVTCGTLHPFMQGELVVSPNLPYRSAFAAVAGLAVACFILLFWRRESFEIGNTKPQQSRWHWDIFRRFPRVEWLVSQRWFQFALVVPNLVVLFFFLLAGLYGSPIGNRNIIVTIVWILWWFLLITLLVPLGGRVWCLLCPIPSFGEWFARRRLIGVRPEAAGSKSLKTGGLNLRWPRGLSNLWLQNLLFLAMCTVSTILVTRPALTAAVLGAMVLAAFVVQALFRRRSFCRYLCPLNAWMSIYSMTAVTEVRTRDTEVCSRCRKRSCALGTETAWGCPWLINPSRLSRNNHCGLCMECIKACPNQNLTLRARSFCADTKLEGYDEAWMSLIMITLVVAYTVTLLGPWGTVKLWANVTEVGNWVGFAIHSAVVWFVALVAMPGLWYLFAWLGRLLSRSNDVPVRSIFIRYSYLLIPLGLLAWTAFSFPLIMVNWTHVTSSLSDPLGLGWDLFGTAHQHWRPLLPDLIPYIQIPLLLLGLGISLMRGAEIARELFPSRAAAVRSLIPHGAMCTAITLVLLRLFVG